MERYLPEGTDEGKSRAHVMAQATDGGAGQRPAEPLSRVAVGCAFEPGLDFDAAIGRFFDASSSKSRHGSGHADSLPCQRSAHMYV